MNPQEHIISRPPQTAVSCYPQCLMMMGILKTRECIPKALTAMFSKHYQIMAETNLVAGMDSSICHSHSWPRDKGLQLRADIVGDVR